jgi:acyl-CoA thioester hydrolase
LRPQAFKPQVFADDERFIRDQVTGQVWHRVFSRPLYEDTDRSNVVHHARYLRYFELGRCTLMRDLGFPFKDVEADGYIYPIIEIGLHYYQSLQYDDPMWIHTLPLKLERVRVRFDYLITNGDTGQILAKGFTRHCCLNQNHKPAAVDEKTVQFWSHFPK